ncbi:MAG: glycosyltransferase [Nitrospinae bacterium]|nr:glycosyltransferase [Nitrospinota bacterium]
MKVALVHDWLTGMRGGENVLEVFCEIFPEADIFTLLHVKGSLSQSIESHRIFTSFLQNFPAVEKKYRWFLPLMPKAIESHKLEGYDLVLSSSHCVAKGIKSGGAPHLCYCFTPMRYAWDMYPQYFNRQRFSAPVLAAIGAVMPYLRRWDQRTANRVDKFVGISHHVADRIKRHYNRDADVVYPPVDVDFYTTAENPVKREGYLVVSAFAPYKRVDLAIEAFNRLGKPLHIAGGGEDDKRLRAIAGPAITFESGASRERLRELYQGTLALIYPGEEDFGIIPVEANACGTPVMAYASGGALETLVSFEAPEGRQPTGVFFKDQTAESLCGAVERFEANLGRFRDSDAIRANTLRFSREVFKSNVEKMVEKFLKEKT